MTEQHGGARSGAGRKRKIEKYQSAIEKAELDIAGKLPDILKNLYTLADGGYERVEEEFVPAGLVTIGSGENWQLAYPDKDPDEWVMVKRKVSKADKDRASNQYLMDRVAGKPTQRQEISGLGGNELEIVVTHARSQPNDS